jgi:hypothetical protein
LVRTRNDRPKAVETLLSSPQETSVLKPSGTALRCAPTERYRGLHGSRACSLQRSAT